MGKGRGRILKHLVTDLLYAGTVLASLYLFFSSIQFPALEESGLALLTILLAILAWAFVAELSTRKKKKKKRQMNVLTDFRLLTQRDR